VPRTSPVCQLELSADSAGKLGVVSEGQGAKTAEQTAGTAEQGAGFAAAQSFTWPSKAERGVLWWIEVLLNCPELVAFLFCSPSSLRLCSKRMAASTNY
jgi:hypothetical protein